MTKKTTVAATPANKAAKPWSGHILDCDLNKPGGMLLGALFACASERGHLLKDMARELGVTYGYISQLRGDNRKVNAISDKFASDCAKYLGISLARVWVLAGKLQAEDLYAPGDSFDTNLANAIEFIGRDPRWGHLLTPELRRADPQTQHMVVKLYEAATGKVLLAASNLATA